MSTPSSDLPPPPPSVQTTPATQIVGQQTSPSSTVPHTPEASIVARPGTQTNSLAVISLVAGIGSFFAHIIPGVGGLTVAVVAVVTGYMARNQIRQTGEGGMALATAGMVIGIVHIVLLVAVVALIVIIFVFGIALFGIAASHSS